MATGDDEAWVPDRAGHHVRTLIAIDRFYRQVGMIESKIERARGMLAAGPSIGIVYAVEDLTCAWAILEAHLELAESMLSADSEEPARELWTAPGMQRIWQDSRKLLARCTALADEWSAAPILIVRLQRLGARLLALEICTNALLPARGRVAARCGRRAAPRSRTAWVVARGRGKS